MRPLLSATGAVLLAISGVGVTAQAAEGASSRPSLPSPGCGASEVESGLHDDLRLDVEGVERQWIMYVPEAHDGATPLPLWLQFPGYTVTPRSAAETLTGAAEEHGFVVVAPGPRPSGSMWYEMDDTAVDLTRANPDVALTEGLLDHVGERLCLDLARVYAAGFSMGGDGASIVACTLEDRVAAVAPVAGVLDYGADCEMDRPLPVLAVHGTADEAAHFDGGVGPEWEVTLPEALASRPVPEQATAVAIRNGCRPEPSIVVPDMAIEAWVDPVELWTWDCPPGSDVRLLVHGGGHVWPETGNVGFDATALIWEFFEQHPCPNDTPSPPPRLPAACW